MLYTYYHANGDFSVVSVDTSDPYKSVMDNMEFSVAYKGANPILKELDGLGGTLSNNVAFLEYENGRLFVGDFVGAESVVVKYDTCVNSLTEVVNRLNALLSGDVFLVERYASAEAYRKDSGTYIQCDVGVFGLTELVEILND